MGWSEDGSPRRSNRDAVRNYKGFDNGRRLTFKHLAGSMVFCAFLVAVLNIYMNIVSTYSVPSLQLDMSPDGDVIGFHQFDFGDTHAHSAGNSGQVMPGHYVAVGTRGKEREKLKKQSRAERVALDNPGIDLSAVHHPSIVGHMRQDILVDDNEQQQQPTENTTPKPPHCPGLCQPVGSPQIQINYVRGLITQRMRNLPPSTFSVGGRQAHDWLNERGSGHHIDTSQYSTMWKTVISLFILLQDWVHPRQIFPANLTQKTLESVVKMMVTANITDAGVPKKGTQLKMAVRLEGDQYALWKPQRYASYKEVPTDTPFAGADRHYAEIAAFYIGITVGLNRVPIVAGRLLNFAKEIVPLAEGDLNATFWQEVSKADSRHDKPEQKRWCFWGKCLYCKKEDSMCASYDTGMANGALILWSTFSNLLRLRSPWARTYDPGRQAPWELEPHFCNAVHNHSQFGHAPTYLDMMDTAVFDWLTNNADRHTFEFFMGVPNPVILLIDNGKAFGGAPDVDELSILAPLYQCCQIRMKVYQTLLRLSEINYAQQLNQWMKLDPLYPVLEDAHLAGINRRLRKLLIIIASCIERHGTDYVLQDDGF